ncbi:MAG: sulfite oxidase [Ferrovibrio sp.]|uniref:sulfite oxidase n=1 Tax=Ferrovibrio sp. TaxID=1917215 RepID=UPI00261765EF|nr:sulfite oxidase [Ferrovibrio sp.]MCW0232003.1 sulfite oxidase [Ferrovibrio sp.]
MAMRSKERGLFELYRDDPERADALVFNRRGILKGGALAAMGAAVGGAIPFGGNMPGGLIPAALAQGATAGAAPKILKMDGKAELVILGDKPFVAETPEHLLNDDITPNDKIFIRNNGTPPDAVSNPDAWDLTVDGEVNKTLKLTLGELKQKFKPVTYALQMECGGNGRSFFEPKASGNQWTNGAISNARWTGVRLKDVLDAAGLKSSAVYTGHYGRDTHLSGDASKPAISRGVPMAKAMEEHTIIAYAVNGGPIPHVNGAPLRLIVPGWPGSTSQKWLSRIWVRDREHDGQGMTGTSYRVPIKPMIPGSKADPKNFRILESMPVRSIITNIANGTELKAGTRAIALRGHAWAGEHSVAEVHVSGDYGQTWRKAKVAKAANKYAWQTWNADLTVPSEGYYEFWVRAIDSTGRGQSHAAANWNPQGYGGNVMHRIAVLIPA